MEITVEALPVDKNLLPTTWWDLTPEEITDWLNGLTIGELIKVILLNDHNHKLMKSINRLLEQKNGWDFPLQAYTHLYSKLYCLPTIEKILLCKIGSWPMDWQQAHKLSLSVYDNLKKIGLAKLKTMQNLHQSFA